MNIKFPERIFRHFDDEIRFFKAWIGRPKTVGAIMPTSSMTTRSMASLITADSPLPVLELGPGTGVITRAILKRGIAPANIFSVEYSKDFFNRLKIDYPDVNFIHGDAFNLDHTLGEDRTKIFDCVISGIPLLNFPMKQRVALVEDLLTRVPPGRPVVQFSYGPVSPVSGRDANFEVVPHDFVMLNVPPARLWVYRRKA